MVSKTFELPQEIGTIINEYAKPLCRLDWKKNPSPSCIAIYKSDYFRDYRCDILINHFLKYGRDREEIDEDTTWEYWCYWRGVIKTEDHRKNGHFAAERGVNIDYCFNSGKWNELMNYNCAVRNKIILYEKWINY